MASSRETVEAMCPGCKVSVTVSGQRGSTSTLRISQECHFCGTSLSSSILENQNNGTRRRSNSLLPSLSLRTPNLVEDSHIGNLWIANLGRLTLGSLGFFETHISFPPVFNSKNRLVELGSGNSTPDIPKALERSGSSHLVHLNKSPHGTRDKNTASQLMPTTIVPHYPARKMDKPSFLKMVSVAKKAKEYSEVQAFFEDTLSHPSKVCATFKIECDRNGALLDDPELDLDYVHCVHDKVERAPASVQKAMLKAIVNCLLSDSESCIDPLYSKDYVRTLFILVQNPIFTSQSTYTIFAHLLQHITRLPNSDHQLLVHWFRILPVLRFKALIRTLLQFISIRQFPPADRSLPSQSKSKWWIPTATKVLALLNASNNLYNPGVVRYDEFYNESLDHMDLMQDYHYWQNPDRPGQFSYCQYPFILSIVAKRHILTKDSEQQMVMTARRSLVQNYARHQPPQIELFFLNISVRRSKLVSDSLKEITEKQKDLKKKLKVSFLGEPGLDMGGLTKEWFQLLIKQIFEPSYGMFVYHPHSRCYWFSVDQQGGSSMLKEYNLVGVLMGLAVYNSIILDLHLPPICYRKLLSPPVVPLETDSTYFSGVGLVSNPTLDDLKEIMPDIARSLKEVLEYSGNIEEDMMLTFEVSVEEYGKVHTTVLKTNKDDDNEPEVVTNENKELFVESYLDWLLNTTVAERFRAFYLGFHSVCASNALIMLRPEEVEQLVCGCPTLDLHELKKGTFYLGFKQDDATIIHFWEVLEDYSEDLKKKFLLFTTGSDRVPVGGTGEMILKISKLKDKPDNLPEAHTCFNQLVLPDYKNKEVLKKKLTIAISNAEGFGLE